MPDDISLSSVSSDPSLDLGDGSDSFATDYSNTAASALQLGTELTAAFTGVQPAPAVVQQNFTAPLPPYGASPTNGGKLLLIGLVVVIVIVVVMSFAD